MGRLAVILMVSTRRAMRYLADSQYKGVCFVGTQIIRVSFQQCYLSLNEVEWQEMKRTEFEKRTEVPVTEDEACGVFCIHSVGRHVTAEKCVDRTLRFRQKALGHIPGLHHGTG